MKKITLILLSVLSLTFSYSATTIEKKMQIIKPESAILLDDEADVPFDFDYKAYLPKDFMAYDLSKNDHVSLVLIYEVLDESLDFNCEQYLPVGFNPKKEFNYLFLNRITLIDDVNYDVAFEFDFEFYVIKYQGFMFDY